MRGSASADVSPRTALAVTQGERKQMTRSRLGLKVLGLSALLVGTMAFASSAAQGESGSHWNVNGSFISSTLLPELQVKELENNDITLLSKLSGKLMELLCTGAAFSGVKLGAEGKIDNGGSILFTGCIFKWGGVVQPKCVPHSAGSPEGPIKTLPFHGLIQLHEVEVGKKEGTVLLLPDMGETFQTFIFGKEGELNECSAGEKMPWSGKLSLKDCLKSFSTEQVSHLFVENSGLTDLWFLNKTAEHKITVDGSAVLALAGASHLGLKWSGTPN
jgi:hypothetical protein